MGVAVNTSALAALLLCGRIDASELAVEPRPMRDRYAHPRLVPPRLAKGVVVPV
jgi:hypothetical protein